jgi:uncharacterized membrane protein YoaK (UPF0700 family)
MESAAGRERSGPRALVAVALALSVCAGFVDAVGARKLGGVLVAHMSGNTAHAARRVTGLDWSRVLHYSAPLAGFLLGLALTVTVAELAHRRGVRRRLALVLVLELALLGLGAAAGTRAPLFASVAWAGAMGAQNAALRHVAGYEVRTTFVTGMLVAFVDELVLSVSRAEPERRPEAWLHGGVWLSFFAGAAGGSLAPPSLAPPAFALAVLAAVDLWRPLAPDR